MQVAITSAGEVTVEVDKEVSCSFKFLDFHVLNNIGYLLARYIYNIKSIKHINYYLQKCIEDCT